MPTIMPFEFLWCYEPEDEDEEEHCNCLLLGTPETVTPLHIDISKIISDKTISIQAIEGATEANPNTYHFKLFFAPGILVEPEKIAVETENWSLYQEENNLYLLWIGEGLSLNEQQATEIILTGVAAASAVKTTTTDVTISWQFKQGSIDIIEISKIPGQNNEYATNTTLELEMIKTSGKSNIPLYVGFVGSNKVMSTHNETNSLQLRITNTNFPGIESPNITFHYDTDAAQCSQLVIVLEVGTSNDVPWALGTKDQVNNVQISLLNDVPWALGPKDQVNNVQISLLSEQWQKKGDTEEIKVGDVVKALQWTFIPKSADVVLQPQETLLIDLNNIVTAHPTGEANLYLRYQYIEGYKDGQFICQIEKAPLVFDDKVRMGTKKDLDGLLTVKDGISLDSPGEIQHTGTLIFRYDVDNSGDDSSVKFFKKDEHDPLMELTSSANLNLKPCEGQRINLWNTDHAIGIQGSTTYFRTSQNFGWYKGGTHDGSPLASGGGEVQMAINNGNVGIGTASPSAKLDVQGTTLITDNLGIGTTSPSAKLDVQGDTVINGELNVTGDYYGKGHIWLHAYEGDGSNGTAYVQARDNSGSSDINLQFRTQHDGNNRNALELTHDGKIRINGHPPIVHENYEVKSGGIVTDYSCSEWYAAIVGFNISTDKKREWAGLSVKTYKSSGGYWILEGDIDSQTEDYKMFDVLFIRRELID